MDQHEQWAVDPGYLLHISWVVPSSQDAIVANEGFFFRSPEPKDYNNPGGDWHPGKGLRHNISGIIHYTRYYPVGTTQLLWFSCRYIYQATMDGKGKDPF